MKVSSLTRSESSLSIFTFKKKKKQKVRNKNVVISACVKKEAFGLSPMKNLNDLSEIEI